MADQERTNNKVVDLRKKELNEETTRYGAADYREETSAEMAAPVSSYRSNDMENTQPYASKDTNQSGAANYREETAAEMAAPVSFERRNNVEDRQETESAGRGIGFAALILSIISLFVSPILFGAAGIVLGFVARKRGAQGLGSWAIGLGVVSIIVGMFIVPFF